MTEEQITERDQFEYWLIHMDDALQEFISSLSEDCSIDLDFSKQSLDQLEKWLLDQFPDTEAILEKKNSVIADGAARYIGETFRKHIGGHWDIELEDPRNAFFGLPILTAYMDLPTPICPLALTTTSVDRRRGDFLSGNLEKMQIRVSNDGDKSH
jgi:hypothetical protein